MDRQFGGNSGNSTTPDFTTSSMSGEECFSSSQSGTVDPFVELGYGLLVSPFASTCPSGVGAITSPVHFGSHGYGQLSNTGGLNAMGYGESIGYLHPLNVSRDATTGITSQRPIARRQNGDILAEMPLNASLAPEMSTRCFDDLNAIYCYQQSSFPDVLAADDSCRNSADIHDLKHLCDSRLECTCGKQFNSRGAAKRHCDSQVPSFECEVCHRYFTRKYNRNAHQSKCASRFEKL